jgi:hypothetical protein
MIGNLVLFGWPLVILILFKRTSKHAALLISVLGGYLLLPERVALDLPLLPSLNKHTLPAMVAFVALLAMDHDRDKFILSGWLPRSKTVSLCLLVLIVGAYLTTYNNGDALVYGSTFLPGLSWYDAAALIMTTLLVVLPFLLARKFLAYPSQQRFFLATLALAGVLYSFPALYEVRMSPQLNNMIYGFYQHSFGQHIRGDGFRPMVFLNHGLWVSIFFALSCLAAAGLTRISSGADRMKYILITLWLFVILFLTKSLGAFAITVCLLPMIFLARRFQLLIGTSIAFVVMLYPILRGTGFIPLDQILEWAREIDPVRGLSFEFRLMNEEILLAKAQERPTFGWGLWGRSLIYDQTGRNTSVTDGYWIIVIGVGGWVKYLAEFGLLCLAPVYLFWKKRIYDLGPETPILTMLLVANLLDLIPNATITPVTWLIAGSLWGRLELGRIEENAPETSQRPLRRAVRYSRFQKEDLIRLDASHRAVSLPDTDK